MKTKILHIIIISYITLVSCEKGWLEEKRDLSIIVPTTLKDMRLLLNNDMPMAQEGKIFAELAADDYYALEDQLNSLVQFWRSAYLWDIENLHEPTTQSLDWNTAYRQVLIANVVLEGLENIEPDQSTSIEYNDIKGGALFFRAKAFFNLVETYCIPYNPATAKNDRGIPLRLKADVNAPIEYASVQETWDKIIVDLKEAATLLKPLPTVLPNASRCAAYALLARVYLCLHDYEQAWKYADLSLQDKSDLLDYNTLNTTIQFPITRFNPEIILHNEMVGVNSNLMTINARIVDDLYNAYDENDLRKVLYFRRLTDGKYSFQGSYTGTNQVFTGIAVNEMYLTRAECNARLGNVEDSMTDLNMLLRKRYVTGEFTEIEASTKEEALEIVLQERRKELLRRAVRWSDIRRLTSVGELSKTFTRTWQNKEYVLTPERLRVFASPIPLNVILDRND